jgi:hypothetical protein
MLSATGSCLMSGGVAMVTDPEEAFQCLGCLCDGRQLYEPARRLCGALHERSAPGVNGDSRVSGAVWFNLEIDAQDVVLILGLKNIVTV